MIILSLQMTMTLLLKITTMIKTTQVIIIMKIMNNKKRISQLHLLFRQTLLLVQMLLKIWPA